MNKSTEPDADNKSMNHARKPNKSLKQRCIEMGAIPFSEFKKEWMRQLDEYFKK